MIEGFKRSYKGDLVDEIYVPLNQLDFSAELTRIAVEQPPAIFAFLPGGMGINFMKQFDQVGLSGKVQVLSVFTADEVALPAQKDAALGVLGGTHWTPNLDNQRNKAFVTSYENTYKAVPATYAANAYDTVFLIDAAVKATHGDTSDVTILRGALKDAQFASVRGKFKFNNNHYPVQDILISKVGKRGDGQYQTEFVKTVFADNADHFATACEMK
ncbi:urea ABC transporter, urea binding protein [compost metagenome]